MMTTAMTMIQLRMVMTMLLLVKTKLLPGWLNDDADDDDAAMQGVYDDADADVDADDEHNDH
eukprot:565889-Karenia_brevis.AAC.1